MNYGITREEAFELVKQHVKSPKMINHCLAAEAVMKALAEHVGEDAEKWGLAGLLHDLDAESHTDLDVHTRETARVLHGVQDFQFQHLLAAGETITGLIVATALVYPDKKLASVKPKSVRKRIKEKAFAAGANRDILRECEVGGVPLAEFCDLSLLAMQGIDNELGL